MNAVANLVKENVISANEADSLIYREALNQFSRSVETDTFDHDSVKEHWEKVLSNGRILLPWVMRYLPMSMGRLAIGGWLFGC